MGALECEHRRIRCETEEDAADRLVMRLSSLGLLRGRVHVTEAAFERAVVEDRRRSRAVIEGVDDLACLIDGPGCGEADLCVLLQVKLTGLANRVPNLGETAQQEAARRAEPRPAPVATGSPGSRTAAVVRRAAPSRSQVR